MTGPRTAFALAMALLVLSIVVAIILIPWLDEKLRDVVVRKGAANDNAQAVAHDAERSVG